MPEWIAISIKRVASRVWGDKSEVQVLAEVANPTYSIYILSVQSVAIQCKVTTNKFIVSIDW